MPKFLRSKQSPDKIPLEMEPLYQERNKDFHELQFKQNYKTKPRLKSHLKPSIKNTNLNAKNDDICNINRCSNTNDIVDRKLSKKLPHLGILLAVGSSLMFSLCSLIVKILKDIPSAELAVFRFAGVFLPSVPLVIAQGEQIFPSKYRFILLLRGIFGTTSLLLQFYSFQHLPLGDASVIVFSAPVFVSLFARIFLKEDCSVFHVIVIIFTLVGVSLITRPPWLIGGMSVSYKTPEWKGAVAAFTGTIVAANVYVLLRVLKNFHYSVILLDFSIIALIITPLVTILTSHACIPPCGGQRWLILAIGFLSFFGQILKTKALQIEEAGPVAIARTADVIFAFIWQIIFFKEIPDALSVVGAVMVTSCVLFLGIRRWILSKPESSFTRRYFAFFTW